MAEVVSDRRGLVDELAELVELESPSGDVPCLDALRDVLAERLTATGARVDIRTGPAGDHIDARFGRGAGPHVLVLGHYDTVWPVGRLAQAPFTVADGWATGPGVFDMKAGLVALLWALRALGEDPVGALRIVLTADEEVGSPSGGSLVLDACQNALAVFALEPPLPQGRLKVGRRGVARVRLRVNGREAHAGLDAASGVSATDELVDQLAALRAAVPPQLQLSLNVGTVHGGSRANVVAGRAEAELGLRFATSRDETTLRNAIESLTAQRDGASLEVEVLSRRPAWEPEGSRALADHVVAVAAALGEDLDTGVSPGGGDANITGDAGIPTVDGLGPRGRGAHAPDEAVEVDSIGQRAQLLLELFRRGVPSAA